MLVKAYNLSYSFHSDKKLRPTTAQHTTQANPTRPFTAKHQSMTSIRNSFEMDPKENRDIENELYEIESRLVKGSTNHYKKLIQKSKLVKASNHAAHMVSLKAKDKIKQDEERRLSNYINQVFTKSKKVKNVKDEIKFYKTRKRY